MRLFEAMKVVWEFEVSLFSVKDKNVPVFIENELSFIYKLEKVHKKLEWTFVLRLEQPYSF